MTRKLTDVSRHNRSRACAAASLTAVAAFLALLALPSAAATPETPRLITVSGEAEERVAPDMATLRMDVVSENVDAAAARREADTVTGKALAVIRNSGVSNADVDSSGLSITPQYQWIQDKRIRELTGYQVSRSIEIRLLAIEKLGELLEQLSDTGVNRIYPPQPGLVDDEALYQKALAAAADNARARAEVLATTLGEQLGPVHQVNVYDNSPRPLARVARMESAMAADSAAVAAPGESYNSGHITFRVTLSVTFSLDAP